MLKVAVITLLIVVILMLALALKDLFYSDSKSLNRSLAIRVGLSILLLAIVVGGYVVGELEVSEALQYL